MLISGYTRAASNHASIAQKIPSPSSPFRLQYLTSTIAPSHPIPCPNTSTSQGDEISDSKPLHSKSNQAQPPTFATVHPHDQKNRVAGTVPRPAQSCRKLALIASVSNNRTPDLKPSRLQAMNGLTRLSHAEDFEPFHPEAPKML
jgi:hypothetical protein